MPRTEKPRSARKLGRNALRALLSLALLTGGVIVFLSLGQAETRRGQAIQDATPVVEVAVAESYTGGIPFTADGVVVPFRRVSVAAEVSGRVAFKAEDCRIGRTVSKGQLLLRIDPRDYQLEIKRLEEELEQAEATLVELDVQIETAQHEIKLAEEELTIRQRELRRYVEVTDPGVVSGVEIDSARRNELAARNTVQGDRDQLRQLESSRSRLESARDLVKANLAKAQLNLERSEIVAPLDGVVVSEAVEQDAYVQQGTEVIMLQDTSQVEVACKLYMSQMHWLWRVGTDGSGGGAPRRSYEFPETPVEVVYDLGPASFVWDGVLQRYEGAGVDNQTRMVPCRVHVGEPLKATRLDKNAAVPTNAPPTLMTGMFVEVRFLAQSPAPLIRLPQSAVQPGNMVWVVRDGQLQPTTVRPVGRDGDFTLIYATDESPRAGDTVVISPLAAPAAGQPVEVQVAT